MQRLYLIRHAKSSWKQGNLSDFDRPLNDRGQHDAPLMGKIIAQHGVTLDRLIASPALRAITTARLIAESLNYPPADIQEDANIYGADTAQLLNTIHSIDDQYQHVALVGHNPFISATANALCGQPNEEMPTCAVIAIEFNCTSWSEIAPGTGTCVFYEYPKKLPNEK